MAYSEQLAERIRAVLLNKEIPFEEKKMMGGLCFMVDDKMCVGIIKDDLMARIGPDRYEEALELPGCREMDFSKRPLKGYVFVDDTGMDSDQKLAEWIQWCLDFNPLARSSKKK